MLSHRVIVRAFEYEGGVVIGLLSALEAIDPQQELYSGAPIKHGDLFLADDPRHTPVRQDLDYLSPLLSATLRCCRTYLQDALLLPFCCRVHLRIAFSS